MGHIVTERRYTVLAVATEWDSGHGGLSTFNRELCATLARLGHAVFCAVPRLHDGEVARAAAAGVRLVAPRDIPGLEGDAALSRPLLGVDHDIDVIIGHGRKTGAAALAQLDYRSAAKYVHFVHMDPSAIEWHKAEERDDRDATRTASERVELEVRIGAHAALIMAVGPELRGAFAAYFHPLRRMVHEFLPGLSASDWTAPPPADQRCLVFGRAEDSELKGVNFAADAMADVCEDPGLRLAWFVVRGSPPGAGDELRAKLVSRVGERLRIVVHEYTADRQKVIAGIRESSLVLMPSLEEGFGLTGLEAISEGVPVLLSRTSGLSQALERLLPEQAPFHVFDVADGAKGASLRIREILRDPDAAHRRALALRDAMKPHFDWEQSCRSFVRLLDEIQGGPSPGPSSPPTQPPPSGDGTPSTDALVSAFKDASMPLLSWRQTLHKSDVWLVRPEFDTILDHLAGAEPTPVVLLGPPGSGKSALLSRIAAQLIKDGVALLGLKADRLAAGIDSREKLASELGFPTDVARALRASAKLKRTVLVIDQLDALADMVDLRTERLGVLLELVQEVSSDGIPVLMSCRAFDFDHDVRFQRLEAKTIKLEKPSTDEIDGALKAAKIDPRSLPPRLRDLLSSVHALDAFLQLKPLERSSLMETHQQLLDVLWKQRLGRGDSAKVLDTASQRIAAMMADREELWLTGAVLAEAGLDDQLKQLEECGLLIEQGGRFAFTHQTLFDYARARAFLARESLPNYVRKRQDALFVRPTLWTGLAYLRAMDPSRYIEQVEDLWHDDRVRPHIHALLIQFVGQVKAPSHREVALLVPELESDKWRGAAIQAVVGRAEWFEELRERHLPPLMRGPYSGMAAGLLTNALTFAADEVLGLMERNWMPDPSKYDLIASVISHATQWPPRVQAMAEMLVVAPSLERYWLDSVVQTAISVVPEFAPTLLSRRLICDRDAAVASGDVEAFKGLLDTSGSLDGLLDAAGASPVAFAKAFWPVFADLVVRVAREHASRKIAYAEDYCLGTSLRYVPRDLAQGLDESLRSWARADGLAAARFVLDACELDAIAVHRFIIVTLETGLPSSAPEALGYLLGDPRRLNVGESAASEDSSVRLIRALVPFLTATELQELKEAIVRSDPWSEAKLKPKYADRVAEWNLRRRLRLLRALGRERLPENEWAALEAEAAARPDLDHDYGRIEGGKESALTPAELIAARDEDIVAAFDELPDSSGWEHPSDPFRGGSVQLSQALAEAARQDPQRFLNLLTRFSPGVTETPVEMAIQALAEKVEPELIQNAVLDLHQRGFFRVPEYQRGAAYALDRAVRRGLVMSDVAHDLLRSWLKDAEPSESSTQPEAAPTEEQQSEPLLWGYMGGGSLPDGNFPVLWALRAGYLARPVPMVDVWVSVLEEHLARRENADVWEALASELTIVLRVEASRAERLLDGLFAKYPGVRDSPEGMAIIARAMHRLPLDVCSRWIGEIEAGRWLRRHQAVGELLFLLGSRRDAPPSVVQRLENEVATFEATGLDSSGVVLGIVHGAAQLWLEADRRALSTEVLARLVPRVWNVPMAEACMAAFSERSMLADSHTKRLLSTLTATPRVLTTKHGMFFFKGLHDLLPALAQEIATLMLSFVTHVRTSGDNKHVMWRGADLVDIAMTLQRLAPPIRERGLDLFEELLAMNVYEARSVLDELDPSERSAGPRPPRRQRRVSRARRS